MQAVHDTRFQEYADHLQSESDRKSCFRISRQMAREGRYVIGVRCMENDVGNGVSDVCGTYEGTY